MDNIRIAKCADRISLALRYRGMRQTDLCRITKIPKSAMSQYLSGNFEPKQDRLYLIAQALDVSEIWLMGYDVPMQREKESSSDKPELTEGEKKILELFSHVPEDKQKLVLQMIRAALENQE